MGKLNSRKKLASASEQVEKVRKEHNPEVEKMVESYKKTASDLEKANQKLSKEIKELNDVIEEKSKEIIRLQGAEYEVDSLKAELLMKELQMKNVNEDLNIKSKMRENERKNDVLRLKHDLENAQDKIREFEAEKESIRQARIRNSKSESTQTENPLENRSPQKIDSIEINSPQKSYDNIPKTPEIARNDSESSFGAHMNENGQVNQQYLKNVILKLFCYLEGNNVKEAKVLMETICIMLKMSPQDREKIEDAKKGNSMWSNTMHFLKDTFTAKGDVNYYTSTLDSK